MKAQKFNNAMDHVDDDLIAAAEKKSSAVRHSAKLRVVALLAAALLVFVGIFATVIVMSRADATTIVAFDVNPSIELELDKNEKVVEARALNADAEKVIASLELVGADIEDAVDAIVVSMVQNGYLSVDQNSILVSVKSGNTDRATALQDLIQTDIKTKLNASNIDASIITQIFDDDDDDIERIAGQKGISVAKAILIKKVLEAGITDSDGIAYDYDRLAALRINELKLLIESKGLNVGGVISSGNASTGAYIDKQAAIDTALAHAGIAKSDTTRVRVEMDYDNGRMLYEVEFNLGKLEYEYEINAVTGEIVEFEQDADDDDDDDDKMPSDVVTEAPGVNKDAAVNAALAHAGLTRDSIRDLEVELKNKKGQPVYEIEFETAALEYEYIISATDGSVIHHDTDRADD